MTNGIVFLYRVYSPNQIQWMPGTTLFLISSLAGWNHECHGYGTILVRQQHFTAIVIWAFKGQCNGEVGLRVLGQAFLNLRRAENPSQWRASGSVTRSSIPPCFCIYDWASASPARLLHPASRLCGQLVTLVVDKPSSKFGIWQVA